MWCGERTQIQPEHKTKGPSLSALCLNPATSGKSSDSQIHNPEGSCPPREETASSTAPHSLSSTKSPLKNSLELFKIILACPSFPSWPAKLLPPEITPPASSHYQGLYFLFQMSVLSNPAIEIAPGWQTDARTPAACAAGSPSWGSKARRQWSLSGSQGNPYMAFFFLFPLASTWSS